MRLIFAGFLIVFSVSGPLARPQPPSMRKALTTPDHSKARAWAEAVTDFLASPRILEPFEPDDVTKRLEALVPPTAFTEEGDYAEGNIQKGVARLRYVLDGNNGEKKIFGGVTIYMPRTDPDGVDVLTRVIACMKRKLHNPWVGYQRKPTDGGYYWDNKKALLQLSIEPVDDIPEIDGKDRKGSWVWVSFGRVEGFGQP